MLRDRQIVEDELTLVRRDREKRAAVARGETSATSMTALALRDDSELKGCEVALRWVLDGVPAPGPITGDVVDPEDRHQMWRERSFAEDLGVQHYDQAFGPVVSREAVGTHVPTYARGVALTLAWVSSDDPEMSTARGSTEQDIPDEIADMADDDLRTGSLYDASFAAPRSADAVESQVGPQRTTSTLGRLLGRKGPKVP